MNRKHRSGLAFFEDHYFILLGTWLFNVLRVTQLNEELLEDRELERQATNLDFTSLAETWWWGLWCYCGVVWNNGVVGVYLVSASHVQMRFHKDLTLVSFPQLCWYKGGIPRTTLKAFYKLDMSFSSNLHSVNTSFQKFILCIVEVISGCFIDLMLLIKNCYFFGKGLRCWRLLKLSVTPLWAFFSK